MGHLVVCSSKLEAKDGGQVLSFEENLAAHPGAHIGRMCEGRFREREDLVDFRADNESDILRHGAQRDTRMSRILVKFGTHIGTAIGE